MVESTGRDVRSGSPQRIGDLFGDDDNSMAISSGHVCCADGAFRVDVLVAVEKPARTGSGHVAVEGAEADVNFVVAVVNHPRRVVGHEYIDARECSQRALHLGLLK